MVIRWDSESDWENNQDSSGTTGRNGDLKQGYSRESPDLSNGLVGYWPLHDENATDYSGNNNHGNLNGGVTTGVAGCGGLQAMSFDGSSNYINLPNLNNEFSTGPPATFTAWVKTSNSSSSQAVISSINSNSTRNGSMIISNGNLGYYDTNAIYESSLAVADGDWHFIAVVDDGTDVKYFVDDQSELASGDSDGWDGGDYWSIGRREAGPGWYFQGTISGIRAYNRALSDSEINTLYRWGSGDFARPPTQDEGGISYWPLDGNADDQWGENNGSVNGASFVDDAIRGQACDFTSDQGDYISVPRSTELEPSTFTVSVWVKRESYSGEKSQRVIDKGGNNYGYQISFGNSGDQDPYKPIAVVGDTFLIPPTDIHSLGEWYHVVLVYDGSTASLYSNGVNIASESASISYDSRDLYIGQRDDGAKHYNGLIDDVRIYNKALTPEEIFELYRYGTRGRDMRKQLVNY